MFRILSIPNLRRVTAGAKSADCHFERSEKSHPMAKARFLDAKPASRNDKLGLSIDFAPALCGACSVERTGEQGGARFARSAARAPCAATFNFSLLALNLKVAQGGARFAQLF